MILFRCDFLGPEEISFNLRFFLGPGQAGLALEGLQV
jgi:hypothetical protein